MAKLRISILFIENNLFYYSMRSRRINKAVLVEEQTVPDRKAKIAAPKQQAKANLRYGCIDTATSFKSLRKTKPIPHLSSPNKTQRNREKTTKATILPFLISTSPASATFAGPSADDHHSCKLTPTIPTWRQSSKRSETRRKATLRCCRRRKVGGWCLCWTSIKPSSTPPSPSSPNTTLSQR